MRYDDDSLCAYPVLDYLMRAPPHIRGHETHENLWLHCLPCPSDGFILVQLQFRLKINYIALRLRFFGRNCVHPHDPPVLFELTYRVPDPRKSYMLSLLCVRRRDDFTRFNESSSCSARTYWG